LVSTSVWRFSNPDPVLIVRTGWHGWLWERDGEPISGSHMNENQLGEPVFFFFRTGQVLSRELASSSR
jgi:hypothetical protein